MKHKLLSLLTAVALTVNLFGTAAIATDITPSTESTDISSSDLSVDTPAPSDESNTDTSALSDESVTDATATSDDSLLSDDFIHPLTPEEEATDSPVYLPEPRTGNTVIYEYNTGGNTLQDVLGCSRSNVLNTLKAHVNDTYYLNTPYVSGDHRNPNGDPYGYGTKDTAGVPAMNCTGFVWHVLTSSGGSGVPGISGWVTLLEQNNIEYRTCYNSSANVSDLVSTILEDGYITPGDIIWTWDSSVSITSTGLPHGLANSHHTGIYIGNYFDEVHTTGVNWLSTTNSQDRWWHSTNYQASSKGFSGNQTTNISPITTCKAITVIKLSSEQAVVEEPSIYTDVETSSLYYEYIVDVTEAGLMEGYSDGSFGPDNSLTRGQFAAILYRAEGCPETTYSAKFPDVKDNIYYSLPITWASEQGLVLGYNNGNFGPNDALTREQLATMMYRYAKWKGDDVTATGDYTKFLDGADVREYAQEAMNWAIGKGILQGNTDGYLLPQNNATRANCAAILSRYFEL